VEAVQRDLADRDEALRQLKAQLLRAQERMKNQADRKRTDRCFVVGEWVFVKLRAHRQKSVVTRISPKLSARYYGPYPIIEKVGAVAYKLKLPVGSRIHPVFHVSLLKKAVGEYNTDEELPDLLADDQIDVYEPEHVLATRKLKQQGEEVNQVLIQWKGKSAEEATWEDMIMIRSQFPKFNLEDKVIADEGGIDRSYTATALPHEQLINNETARPRNWLVYSRRGRKGNSG
jgi:hypothetical protein